VTIARSNCAVVEFLFVTGLLCGCSGENKPDGPIGAPVVAAPTEAVELTGVEWRLVAIEQTGGESIAPDPLAVPTLAFDEEQDENGVRRFAGSGGCNRFSGGYVAGDDGSIRVSSPPIATRMACPPPIMDFEMVLFAALASIRSYEIDGDRLVITYEGGALRFVAAPPGT
jgi:heat shock protein HslJ